MSTLARTLDIVRAEMRERGLAIVMTRAEFDRQHRIHAGVRAMRCPVNVDAMAEDELSVLILHPLFDRRVQEYAKHTLAARQARLAGNIQMAGINEDKAEAIYRRLPRSLRW